MHPTEALSPVPKKKKEKRQDEREKKGKKKSHKRHRAESRADLHQVGVASSLEGKERGRRGLFESQTPPEAFPPLGELSGVPQMGTLTLSSPHTGGAEVAHLTA